MSVPSLRACASSPGLAGVEASFDLAQAVFGERRPSVSRAIWQFAAEQFRQQRLGLGEFGDDERGGAAGQHTGEAFAGKALTGSGIVHHFIEQTAEKRPWVVDSQAGWPRADLHGVATKGFAVDAGFGESLASALPLDEIARV